MFFETRILINRTCPARHVVTLRTPSEKSSLGKVQPIAQAPVAEQEEACSVNGQCRSVGSIARLGALDFT